MTKKRNTILALTVIACFACAGVSMLALAYDAPQTAVFSAFGALAFGGIFKICAQDFGVWG